MKSTFFNNSLYIRLSNLYKNRASTKEFTFGAIANLNMIKKSLWLKIFKKKYSEMNILFFLGNILNKEIKRRKKLIYTITFNPALDYKIQIKNFQPGEINRSEKEHIVPGGKGINVSIVLKTLGLDSTAFGFIAGFVGEEIERKVKEYGVKTDFIKIENNVSRINVKIAEEDKETAINGKGPFINESYIELLYKKLEIIQNGDILILSGSVPKGISNDIYKKICKELERKDVKIIVDSTGELLLKTLKYHPFLIKPNQEELGDIFGVKISSQEDAIKYAEELQIRGAQNVLVSLGDKGAVLLDKNGYSYKMKALKIENVINTVGAGDSMVAGFLFGYETFYNYEKALQMGIAAGTATTQSTFLATNDQILQVFKALNLEAKG